MKIIKAIVYFINVIVVIVTLLSYISPFVNPSQFWAFSFFGLIFPILLFLNLFFIVYWFFASKKKMLLSVFVLILGFSNVLKTISFNIPEKVAHSGISVLSYNLNQGNFLYKNKIKKGELGIFINKQNVDILLVQESSSKRIHKELGFAKKFKFKHKEKRIGTAIYSKNPIINSGRIDFNLKTNSCLWADIKFKNDTLRVYSVHFQSNKISKQADEIAKDFEKDQAVKSKDVRLVLSKYKANVQIRAAQVRKVRKHILNSPYKVILGGDFNDPAISYTYQEFAELLKDSFKEKGFGMEVSYAGSIPFLRIDNIFVSPDIEVLEFHTLKDKYSDHYAIKSILKL